MEILLTCAGGMSTSLLGKKMEEEAESRGLKDVTVVAEASGDFKEIVDKYDVVLLGPQIRYKEKEFRRIAEEKDVALGVIDSVAYGMVDGKKVLDQALELAKNN